MKKKYNFNSYGFLLDNKLAIGNSNGALYIWDINKEDIVKEHCLLVRNL